jgi:hypothetical protein
VLRYQPPLEQFADRQEGGGWSDGPILGELGREFTAALLGVVGYAVKPERSLHCPTRDWVDADGDADLEHPGPAFAQRSLAPGAHRAKIGPEVGSQGDPYF